MTIFIFVFFLEILQHSSSSTTTSYSTLSQVEYSTDCGLWNVSNHLTSFWIEKGPSDCQNSGCVLGDTFKKYDSGKRYLNKNIFERQLLSGERISREWLLYSPSQKKIYCFVCRLLSIKKSTFSHDGFDDWKYTDTYVTRHENTVEHKNCMLKYITRKKSATSVHCELVNQFENEKKYWYQILERLFMSSSF